MGVDEGDLRVIDVDVILENCPISISPPSFCGACLNFYSEKDSAVPFPRRTV